MSDEKQIGTLYRERRPQSLLNLEKGNSFKSSVEFFRNWDNLSEQEKEEITPTEKVGIYCIVFSMLEDRLETLWWNCSYVHQWNVIGVWEWNDKKQNMEMVDGPPPVNGNSKTGRYQKELDIQGISEILYSKIGKSIRNFTIRLRTQSVIGENSFTDLCTFRRI